MSDCEELKLAKFMLSSCPQLGKFLFNDFSQTCQVYVL